MIRRVLFWDWKEQPDLNTLGRIITEMSTQGPVHLTGVPNTGMDSVAVIITHRPLTPSEADAAFQAYLEESND